MKIMTRLDTAKKPSYIENENVVLRIKICACIKETAKQTRKHPVPFFMF